MRPARLEKELPASYCFFTDAANQVPASNYYTQDARGASPTQLRRIVFADVLLFTEHSCGRRVPVVMLY